MPIPLPNLDTRRWSDLVDEGRALIPRYARRWTDHNVHDPGITLIELFAWLIEQLIYRANRIPDRHLRKFLALAGRPPKPPLPASVVVSISLAPGAGTRTVPPGILLLAQDEGGGTLAFQLVSGVALVEADIVALQMFDGAGYADRTSALRDGLPVSLFGDDPRVPDPYDAGHAPACYFGFDRPLPASTTVSLYCQLGGGPADERARILAEARESTAACERSPFACTPCVAPPEAWCTEDIAPPPGGTPPGGGGAALPPHHSVRTVWEYFGSDNAWHVLREAEGEVTDETRGLTLSGFIRLEPPSAMGSAPVGALAAPLYYVRCRLLSGGFDAPPVLLSAPFNAALAEQTQPASQVHVIAAGVVPGGALVTGARVRLDLAFDAQGVVQRIGVLPAGSSAPELLVFAYQPPAPAAAGSITLGVVNVGTGTGLPEQLARLSGVPVTRAALSLFALEPGTPATWRSWRLRPDLDSSGATDADATLDAVTGDVGFGDGVRGRTPIAGSTLLADYATTLAGRGNVGAMRPWQLPDVPLNRALLGPDFAALAAATVRNRAPATGGADAEALGHAAARAAGALWSHERLVELSPAGVATLDQLDRDIVLDRDAPARLSTVLDAERLALEIPGTRVRRARAWAGLDPEMPCAEATGTITLVIVPELPRGRPVPTAGLLRAVRRYLSRRRVLCTRLVVVGPEYLDVSVQATVRALPSADGVRVQRDVTEALTRFLDPLGGGPTGRGWPFGRDVYRSEVLAVIDRVPGVDHVLALALSGGGQDALCGNLCVAATWLVASGMHDITVVGP